MWKYLTRRIIFTILTLFGVCALTFFLMNVIPGSTAEMILKYTFIGIEENPTDAQIAELSSLYHLNDPMYVQFFRWLDKGLLHGDMGTSYVFHLPVLKLISIHLPATIQLALASMAIAIIAGIPLGVYAAVRENRLADSILRIVTILGASMPGFWVGLILILVFAVNLKLVPVSGFGRIENLVLPSLALSLHSMAAVVRVTRASMLETLGDEYIRFAIAKGIPSRIIITRHALKNAMLPVVTVIGFQLGHLLGGTMVIESIFSWPGIGSLLVNSISARDLPVVQACVLTIVAMFLLVNLSVDLVYTYLDPRIRYG